MVTCLWAVANTGRAYWLQTTIEAGAPIIVSFDIRKNREIHVTNNAGHIQALDDGHSRQAPADFVRIAVLEGLATVRGAKILDD